MTSKHMVWAHPDGTLRFVPLAFCTEGEQPVVEARRSASGVTTLQQRSLHVTEHDASAPLFLRQHFGSGAFELLGHVSLGPGQALVAVLEDFAERVYAAVGGRRGCWQDERNRAVFCKTVDFLVKHGDLGLVLPAGLLDETAAALPYFNF